MFHANILVMKKMEDDMLCKHIFAEHNNPQSR